MARQPRQRSGTGIYHVMLRGINRQDIFEDNEDFLRFMDCIRGLVLRCDEQGYPLPPLCTFYAYCLMSNHVHLLIREREESVSDTIKRLGVSYSHYYNKKYERTGHLFQDRFKSEPVNDMNYFVTLLRYIHQNPVKAGIVADVDSYPWSSWSEYKTQLSVNQSICAIEHVLKRLPFEDFEVLVREQLEDGLEILDFDNDGKYVFSDDDIRVLLNDKYGIKNPKELQSLPKEQRNDVLNTICDFGATLRQASRMTGISFGVIRKARKHEYEFGKQK